MHPHLQNPPQLMQTTIDPQFPAVRHAGVILEQSNGRLRHGAVELPCHCVACSNKSRAEMLTCPGAKLASKRHLMKGGKNTWWQLQQ